MRFGPTLYKLCKVSLEYIGGLALMGSLLTAAHLVAAHPGAIFVMKYTQAGVDFLIGAAIFVLFAISLYCANEGRSAMALSFRPERWTRQRSQNIMFVLLLLFAVFGLLTIVALTKAINLPSGPSHAAATRAGSGG